jgi:hypothetical protein
MQRAFILISLGLAIGGCSANEGDEGIFITKNVSPGDGCTFSAAENEHFLTHGTMSLVEGGSYQIYPQMISKITADDTNIPQRTILVRGARVDVEMTDKDINVPDSVLHFESRFTAPIAPNGGITDASFVGLSTELIDALRTSYGSTPNFETEVIIHAVVYGDLSGSEVTSQVFQFPVTVCTNCVVNNLGMCPLQAGTPVRAAPSVCSLYQDGFSDCCTGPSGLICPAIVGAQYALTVTVNGVTSTTGTEAGVGVVTSTPTGINCGGDCDQTFNQDTMVTLTPTPSSNSTFGSWAGACTGMGACVVTMDGVKTVTATFIGPP